MAENLKTIIIGLGNPILCDDSVGPKAARLIRERLNNDVSPERGCVSVSEVYAGGIRLLDKISGYDRAIIIDSIVTGEAPGTVYRLTPESLPQTRNCGSSHDMTFPMALSMGKMLGMSLPSDIQIWAIEAKDVNSFGEELSGEVEGALPNVINDVLTTIKRLSV
ncbi:MAG: hydrogenase maturation protease [Nitrospirae bacterium]|nr:hydrogenase maturation protease [Nitrospirota bacterium]MBF0535928.1 hydrogenase maturation protease [Nitrospirota bacterium]MBF0617740.1 hydrogenase maturation protease [Nitrospirota bacterium]